MVRAKWRGTRQVRVFASIPSPPALGSMTLEGACAGRAACGVTDGFTNRSASTPRVEAAGSGWRAGRERELGAGGCWSVQIAEVALTVEGADRFDAVVERSGHRCRGLCGCRKQAPPAR